MVTGVRVDPWVDGSVVVVLFGGGPAIFDAGGWAFVAVWRRWSDWDWKVVTDIIWWHILFRGGEFNVRSTFKSYKFQCLTLNGSLDDLARPRFQRLREWKRRKGPWLPYLLSEYSFRRFYNLISFASAGGYSGWSHFTTRSSGSLKSGDVLCEVWKIISEIRRNVHIYFMGSSLIEKHMIL